MAMRSELLPVSGVKIFDVVKEEGETSGETFRRRVLADLGSGAVKT